MPNVYILLEEDNGSVSAFRRDGGEVLEFNHDVYFPVPDTEEGGIVEPHRAGDPTFAAALGPALTTIEACLARDRSQE